MRLTTSAIVWLFSLVVFAATLIVAALWLPERVATHFDIHGAPNGWMSRGQHLLLFGAFGIGISGFFVGLFFVLRYLPPSMMNVSNPEYWRAPENYPRACDFLFENSFPIATLVAFFVSGINLLLVRANLQPQPALSSSLTIALAAAFLSGMVVWVIRMLRFFRRIPKSEVRAHE